jgi:flagellar hook assembly protein FlgD
MAELGEGMHIGNNVTNYAWDGTDEYGKALANGLYMYRVVTNLKQKSIDHFETSVDKYFKSGFGKMYLMR